MSTAWAFRVRVSKDAEGRWSEVRRSGFETRREAERELAQIVASLHRGSYVRATTLTLAEFLVGKWLPATAPPHVRHETWEDRRRNLEHHVVARIGDIRLQDLNASHLNKLYGELLTDGRVDDDGGLSPTSVRRIHAMLRKSLNDALRWGLIERNVATLADPPPARLVQAARRRSMRTWGYDELRTFLRQTEGHPLHLLWVVAVTTGMRRSELLGLQWDDVDLVRSTVTVRRTVVPGLDGYELMDAQKSTTSARTIHLDGRTAAMLRRHRERQQALGAEAEPISNSQSMAVAGTRPPSRWPSAEPSKPPAHEAFASTT